MDFSSLSLILNFLFFLLLSYIFLNCTDEKMKQIIQKYF